MSEKKNTFFGGAAILAVGVVVVKIIGALYKIPLANILGDTANGYFNSAYTIYAVLLTISTGGLPVALSKQVSEAHALGLVNQRKRIFSIATRTLFLFGLSGFLIMFLGAKALTYNILGNPGAYCATLVLAPAPLFVCCMSALRGYAQGQGVMSPTAISQIIEALCKLILGLTLATLLLDYGASMTDVFTPQELAVGGAIAGVTIGTLASLIFLTIDRIRRSAHDPEKGTDTPQPDQAILSRLVRLAVPITLGCSVVPIVNFLDAAQVQNRLQEIFFISADSASALYGSYAAATNLYNLPSSLMEPFGVALIPAVSAARARRNSLQCARVSESALRVAMLLACPMGFGLAALSTPIITMLYSQYDPAVMGPILTILGFASICTCIVVLSNAILHANGQVKLPFFTIALGGTLKLLVNYILVGTQSIGILGAPVGTLVCFGTTAVLDLLIIRRSLPTPPRYTQVFCKPLLASAIMALAAWSSHGLLFRFLGSNTIATLGGIIVAILVYGILILCLKAISKEDLILMPKGEKVAKILRIR